MRRNDEGILIKSAVAIRPSAFLFESKTRSKASDMREGSTWPPPWLAVEVKIPNGFPTSFPAGRIAHGL
jgi:hypothetical protein